nr:immunoglobulin light chain junction region [Macaca mulatta]MOX17283.1 immunoglobulin light chain junction region [Macaca mulatta]MOX20059.1 immunoglobulin light chain junction region [Macaca mulatta]MOX21298.1 immunoglobulin light chain junction region [Macaca mulatta]MOX21869.1 immunoglobulin light chain junction region [Macaca mulatta]
DYYCSLYMGSGISFF